MVTLVATGVDVRSGEPVWVNGAQTAAGYTSAAQTGAGQGLAALPEGTVIEAAAGAGHAFGWQTAGGKGSTSRLFRSAAGSSFSFSGTPNALTLSAADSTATAQVTFTPPSGRVLEPGTYATGDRSALDWSGEGTCASETHTFTIAKVSWAADGTTLTGLDATFAGSCGTSVKGRILINATSLPTPATATATATRMVVLKTARTQKSTKVAITGNVVCAGTARIMLDGRVLAGSRPIAFTAIVDCTPGATVSWYATSTATVGVLPAKADYWVSGTVLDGFYRYSGDMLTKDKKVAVSSAATLPRK